MYNEINTKKYMIIPVYDTVVLPAVDMQMKIYDLTENEKSRIKIDGNKAVLLPLKEDARPGEITAGSFYGLGVLADIRSVSQSKMGTILHATTLDKVSVSGISNVGEILEGACSIIPEEKDITAQGERELLDSMKGISGEIAAKFEGGDMAMRYIRRNAEFFEIDRIAALGFSAGGHLCGTLGTMYDCPEVADLGDASLLRPDALGLCYPVLIGWGPTHEGTFENISGGSPALRARLSLDKQVRPDMPPVFLWHTRDDNAVPCRNSLIMACALEEKGVDLEKAKSIDMRQYIYNMPTVMAAADVVIARAGAATCNEIAATGTPSILIPSPNVTDNHQEKNARALEAAGGAVVVLESECTAQRLMDELSALLSDRERHSRMGCAVQRMAVPDSAERICDILEALAKE